MGVVSVAQGAGPKKCQSPNTGAVFDRRSSPNCTTGTHSPNFCSGLSHPFLCMCLCVSVCVCLCVCLFLSVFVCACGCLQLPD